MKFSLSFLNVHFYIYTKLELEVTYDDVIFAFIDHRPLDYVYLMRNIYQNHTFYA